MTTQHNQTSRHGGVSEYRRLVDPETLICPGCGEQVHPEPPGYWRVADGFRHRSSPSPTPPRCADRRSPAGYASRSRSTGARDETHHHGRLGPPVATAAHQRCAGLPTRARRASCSPSSPTRPSRSRPAAPAAAVRVERADEELTRHLVLRRRGRAAGPRTGSAYTPSRFGGGTTTPPRTRTPTISPTRVRVDPGGGVVSASLPDPVAWLAQDIVSALVLLMIHAGTSRLPGRRSPRRCAATAAAGTVTKSAALGWSTGTGGCRGRCRSRGWSRMPPSTTVVSPSWSSVSGSFRDLASSGPCPGPSTAARCPRTSRLRHATLENFLGLPPCRRVLPAADGSRARADKPPTRIRRRTP